METDYSLYLKGIDRPVRRISILEIGAAVGSPIFRELPSRKAEKITYRSICLPFTGVYSTRNEYHTNAQNALRDKTRGEETSSIAFQDPDASSRINAISFEWKASDIPYPFNRNSFDEVHCHMITDTIIDPGYCPSLPSFSAYASELARIIKPLGRYFLSVQQGYFFETFEAMGSADTVVGSMERFAEKLRNYGFTPEAIDYDGRYDDKVPPEIRSKRGEVSPFRIKHFTDNPSEVNAVLVARRNVK